MLPILISFGDFHVYSYPLFIGLAWGVSYHFSLGIIEATKGSKNYFYLFFFLNFIFTWLGSKIFFLLFSSQNLWVKHTSSVNFWLGGGFVFYGGLVFALCLNLILYRLFPKEEFKRYLKLIPGLCFAHAIGRVGCFLAGCCFGKESDFFISFDHKIPIQLYEALGLVLIGLYLIKKSSYQLELYLIFYSVLRFILEFFRGDEVRGIYFNNLSTSQIVSIILFILGLIFLIKNKSKFRAHTF